VMSDDLLHWSNRRVVFTHEARGRWGGPTESPQVVRRGEHWYLFVGPSRGYDGTDVYRSDNPFHWDMEDRVAFIPAHAPEVVRDLDGGWAITRCGWGRGGVQVAPLLWNDGQDGAATNFPVPR
jgi:arabinan endo-1,5-alpha-L-arabinosidase